VNEILALHREYELLKLSVQEIANKHQRTPHAIIYKLINENIIYYEKNEDNIVEGGIDDAESESEYDNDDDDEDEVDDETATEDECFDKSHDVSEDDEWENDTEKRELARPMVDTSVISIFKYLFS
jgi:predicted transcriptional regulator